MHRHPQGEEVRSASNARRRLECLGRKLIFIISPYSEKRPLRGSCVQLWNSRRRTDADFNLAPVHVGANSQHHTITSGSIMRRLKTEGEEKAEWKSNFANLNEFANVRDFICEINCCSTIRKVLWLKISLTMCHCHHPLWTTRLNKRCFYCNLQQKAECPGNRMEWIGIAENGANEMHISRYVVTSSLLLLLLGRGGPSSFQSSSSSSSFYSLDH